MEMLVDVLDPEPERGHREEAVAFGKELANMKQYLVDPGLDTGAVHDRVGEHAGRAQAPVGETRSLGLDPPYLNAQACGRSSARDVYRMNRNAACHLAIPLLHVHA